LGIAHAGIAAELRERTRRRIRVQLRERAMDLLELTLLGGPDLRENLLLLGRRDVCPEADQELARDGLRGLLDGSGTPRRPVRTARRECGEHRRGEDGKEWDAVSTAFHQESVGAASDRRSVGADRP